MTAASRTDQEITTGAQLADVLGVPLPRIADKARPELAAPDVEWIAASPFVVIGTSAADGSCDASPKGDPPGFVQVLSPTRLAVPERPGNRRADGFRNVLSNPHVGLLFLIPGRTETLRVNGRARLLRDADYFDAMAVKGRRPVMAMEVAVEEVYFHCAKAFLRSGLWRPEDWPDEAGPSARRIATTFLAPEEITEELVQRYSSASPTLY